ncbi:MAG: cell division protein FtsW [Cryomorphaceae bacterium]|jgi:cell division protein FtsW|nr:MAG: cell division protein FtsW [Cryomorphaceae bacterium]|tara:strand:- start:4218 stop:5384 length:1167 start_codon:yes stop_codon:yes gene_type:complete
MSLINSLKGDKIIWIVVLALSIFSFLPVYSASSNFGVNMIFSSVFKHVAIIFIGIIIMYTTHLIDYKYLRGLSLIVLPLAIVLLLITALQGNEISGANASRWISIPFINISFQPSSLASIFLMIYISNYISKNHEKKLNFKNSIIKLWLPILLVVMLVFPSNFSTSFMIFSLSLILIFIGQYPIKNILLIIFSGLILTTIFIGIANKYPDIVPNRVDTWSNRIENFVNPSLDNDSNYQINRAKAAIASGSIFGVGAGKSSMKYILPQSTSDFIFSIITEEYGLIVAIIILLLYIILLFRIVIISYKSNNIFGQLLSLAVGLPIVFQALINMGVAVHLFPVTGQPLPLISTGGTSIWITFFAFGILLSISRTNFLNNIELETEKINNES